MSVLAKLFNAGRAGVTPGGQEQRILTSSAFVPPPQVGVIDDYVGVHRAMACMSVLACVRILADTIASLPWKAYKRDAKGVPKEVKPQPLLLRQPFPGFDLFQWKWMVVASLALRGNSYHLVTSRDKMNYPTSLLPLHPDVVFLERRPDLLLWFDPVYRIMGEEIPTSDLIHIRRFTMPGEPWGLSPVKQAAVAIGVSLASEEYGYRYFKESANPSGILSTDQDLDDKAVERQQKNWIASHGGRRLPAVLTGGFKWEGLSISPEESQFLACVTPGTLITMADGTRSPVEDLRVGNQVMAWNGSKLEAAPVKAIGTPPIKPIVKITTRRGRELTCTADHPILAQKLRMRSNGRTYRLSGEPDTWIAAGELQPGQRIRIALGHLAGEAGHLPANVAYFLGAMTGDGRIHSAGGGSLTWSHDKNVGAINRMADIVHSLGGDLRQRSGHPNESAVTTGGNRGAGSLIRGIVNESGLGGTHSFDKFVPEMITAGGPAAWRAFLSGYFDADGCMYEGHGGNNPSAAFWTSTSRELLEGSQHLLALLGINSSIYLMRGPRAGHLFPNGPYDTRSEYSLRVSGGSEISKLAGVLDLGHSEKHHKLAKYLGCESDVRNRAGQFDYDLIKDVCWLGDGQAVGVEIDSLHTFVTSGIITHNTRQFQRSEICLLYGVPPILIGDTKETTAWGTGVEQITLGAITYTFRSWTGCIESMVSSCLPRGQFVRFDFDALLRGDIEGRYQAYQRAVGSSTGAGWVTPNEIRAKEEMDPVDGGDTLWMSNRMVPAHTALVTPAPDGSPTDGPPGGGVGPASYPTPPIGGGENSDDPASHSRRLLTADGNSFAR